MRTLLLTILCWSTSLLLALAEKPTFRFDSEGCFTMMQVTDIQDTDKLALRTIAFLDNAIKQHQPGVIVLTGDNTASFNKKGEYSDSGYLLNTERASGLLKEVPCPTARGPYKDAAHTYEGRTLYQSWCKMGNLKGAYFGHDHKNTFDGTDKNGIRLGYTKAATLHSYNDNDPGGRIFWIKKDGTFTTETVSEASLTKP